MKINSLPSENVFSYDTKVKNVYDCVKTIAVKLYEPYCTKCIIKNVNMTKS